MQDGKKANALREISWGGQRVPVRSIKVAELLAAVDEQWRALDAAAADALGSYDKLLSTCADAVAAAQADLKADEVRIHASLGGKGEQGEQEEPGLGFRAVLCGADAWRDFGSWVRDGISGCGGWGGVGAGFRAVGAWQDFGLRWVGWVHGFGLCCVGRVRGGSLSTRMFA